MYSGIDGSIAYGSFRFHDFNLGFIYFAGAGIASFYVDRLCVAPGDRRVSLSGFRGFLFFSHILRRFYT